MANASNGAPERNPQRRRALGMALLVVGAAAAAGLVGVAMSATSAGASAPPSVVLDPSAGLIDGQVLTVNWHDFAPGASVVLRQCSQSPVSAADCSKLLQSEPSDDSGSGSTTFPVVVTNGSDRQLAGAPNVACDASSSCSVYVLPDAAPDSLGQGANAQISFAKPTSGCPSPGARSVSAEGTDAVGRALTAWRPVLCEKPDLTSVDYVPKNDPSGRQDFLCGLRDIAIIQGGPLAGEVCNGSGQGRSAPVVLPIAASALSFGYNIHDQKTGRRILDLKLSPSLLAQIFTGQILRWNDPRVAALNPGYNLPTKLRVVVRADASELNRQLTTFFWTTARSAYQGGGPAFADGPTDTYASIPGIDLRTGGDAVAAALASPSDNNPRDDPSYGYIGVVD
ncbi:MAG: substrate-binding domain-containing protein, partial [Actinomycetes bacterium]